MSSILPTDPNSLPPVSQTEIPASVQQAGPKAEQLYTTALDFEQLLLQQLTSEMQDSTGIDGSDDGDGSDDDSDDDGSDGTTDLMSQMLPDAFAQGLTSAGGIGIAQELYTSLAQQAGISTDPAADSSSQTPGTVSPITDGSSSAPNGGPQ